MREGRKKPGFVTTKELMLKLGLRSRHPILRDVREGKLTKWAMPGHEEIKNTVFFYEETEAEEYIQKWHMPHKDNKNAG
jgi:hypothetical protein